MDDINLNQIDVEEIFPQNYRQVPAFAGAINHRFQGLRDEVRNERREIRQRLNENDHRVRNIGDNIDHIRNAITNIETRINAIAVQPAPILVHRENQNGDSANTSAFSSKFTSRPSSPTSQDGGLYPLARNLAYSTQVLLKRKEQKFPDAFNILKKVSPSKEAILDRVNHTSQMIVRQARQEVASMIPEIMGINSLIENENDYEFTEKPEAQICEKIGALARKEIRKEFPSIKGPSENLQFLIHTTILRYNKKLTFSQVKNLFISIAEANFKKITAEAFNAGSVSQAFKFLLSMYGKLRSHSDRSTIFNKSKIDHRNPVSSLYKIFENCMAAYPGKSETEITQVALIHSLSQLPPHLVAEWNSKMASIERMRKLGMECPDISFAMFIDFVIKGLKTNPRGDWDKTIREVDAEKPKDQDRLFDKTLSELNDFKRNALKSE